METALPCFANASKAHAFDWEFGAWETKVRRLRDPLTGSTAWLDYAGTTIVRPVLGGRANVAELSISGSAGTIEGVSLRLFNPKAMQWSIHYASLASAEADAPLRGGFEKGRGTFYGEDTLAGRAILVRFLIIPVEAGQWQFEQAFSDDNGRTWETNWIATDTRTHPLPPTCDADPAPALESP